MKRLFLFLMAVAGALSSWAWEDMDMPELHVEGRWLVDTHGNHVNLHGFAQTYSPWFNEQGSKWGDYNVYACLKYNKGLIDDILDAGWEMSFLRLHMDPYWSNKPGQHTAGEHDISAFDFERFQTYLDKVFIPMAEYAVEKGLYVVMRPPGVCPETIAVGDNYQKYLIKVWSYVASHPDLKNHPNIMFELANEPVHIKAYNGNVGAGTQAHFDALKDYFQAVVDAIRDEGAHNILWVPGLGYQSLYSGYAANPIEGENIGYAVHIYPGWFGSANGYDEFQRGWDKDVKPVADIAPIMVTEMDWADEKYNASWGKEHTGEAGGKGFGANFKLITDKSENVSWLLFTSPDFLAKFEDVPGKPGNYTFLNDPEACPWPVYHWYKEYKEVNYPTPDFERIYTQDQGDGTFKNPVLFGDFPDIDLIRVDDTYYMMSTTMFYMPGATVMRSYDLVNWEYAANPIEYIENDDAFCLRNGQHRYARGMWASSLQYREADGQFYLLYNTLNDGSYLLTAKEIEGPWKKKKLNHSFYDCGILFDGDDIYVVRGNGEIWIDKVDEDFKVIASHKVANSPANDTLEGSRLYHIGGYYYVYCVYCGWPGKQTCFRSKDIFGTYEEKLLLNDGAIHQGALVETDTGEWWTMLFKDMWPWGRCPYLLPVKWSEGWPVIGNNGKGMTRCDMPDISHSHRTPTLATNDSFRHYALGLQWEWNHNPDKTKWSLLERPGYLRLYTATVTNDLYYARNTLSQRMLGYDPDLEHSLGTVKLDLSNMKEGDRCGLATMQDPHSFCGVRYENGKKEVYYGSASLTGKQAATEQPKASIEGDELYLRGEASFSGSGTIQWYYSTDNYKWKKLGTPFTMQYDLSVFVGNRWCIFNYATKELGGWVDVDWFSTEEDYEEDYFYNSEFAGFSEEALTLSKLEIDSKQMTLLTGTSSTPDIWGVFKDGHRENISAVATYAIDNPDVVEVKNGRFFALDDGTAKVKVSYQGPLGPVRKLTITVNCSTFPLTTELFDTTIYGQGTFDEETHVATTGQYGFVGWHYNQGVDLGYYKYLVAKVRQEQKKEVSFRVFDNDSYWSSPVMKKVNSANYAMIELDKAEADDGHKLNSSHIYYVGFWTMGGYEFTIEDVYVTNDDDYLNPSNALMVIEGDDVEVDVYNLQGIRVLQGVTRSEAVRQLAPGLYVIGSQKVLVR